MLAVLSLLFWCLLRVGVESILLPVARGECCDESSRQLCHSELRYGARRTNCVLAKQGQGCIVHFYGEDNLKHLRVLDEKTTVHCRNGKCNIERYSCNVFTIGGQTVLGYEVAMDFTSKFSYDCGSRPISFSLPTSAGCKTTPTTTTQLQCSTKLATTAPTTTQTTTTSKTAPTTSAPVIAHIKFENLTMMENFASTTIQAGIKLDDSTRSFKLAPNRGFKKNAGHRWKR